MPAYVHEQKRLDVICEHTMDGNIIPIKIRLQDEDGQYQSFRVRSYRCTSLNKTPNPMRFPTLFFECKIQSFGQERIIGISFCFADGTWKLSGADKY